MSYSYFVFLFFFSSRRRHTRCALVTGVQTCALPISVARNAVGNRAWRCARLPRMAAAPCAVAVEGGRCAWRLAPHGRLLLQRRKKVPKPILLACRGWEASNGLYRAA